jgi:hypothetical protein
MDFCVMVLLPDKPGGQRLNSHREQNNHRAALEEVLCRKQPATLTAAKINTKKGKWPSGLNLRSSA